ncbi:hypothetical protein CPT_Sycamore_023 [Streptomyces phage Sycamore]|uniref:Uncharacterized protein n=1 Tax=Streptomyces phage Sycamore TaxID=2767589 RepID=A0A873WGV0_9CAUD|nr:hypothetical protein CPT_Sycamore_023 [Streptomyces phage Sycamore]
MSEIKFATVGKGGTVHGTEDETTTLCGKPVAKLVTIPGAAIACKACQKNTPTNEETETVAKNTETKPSADDIKAEVTKDIENLIDVLSTLTKGDKEKIEATYNQGEEELKKVSANTKAGLIMRLKEARSQAEERSSTAVALHAETTTVEEIAGYEEIIDHTSTLVADGIRAEVGAQETAKVVAEAILDARLRVFDKKGRPDLKGSRDAAKKLSGRIYDAAAEKLIAGGFDNKAADFDDLRKDLEGKVSYQMSAVLPAFVRTLDDSPEQFAELWPALVSEVSEDRPASEIIFDEYKINRESQAERAARKRREAKELANEKKTAGELEGGEGEGEETEGEGEGEGKSKFEKDKAKLGKMGKDLVSVVDNADDYDDEQRDELRKLITETLTALSDALTKL